MGGFSTTDPTYGGFSSDDEGDDLQRQIAKVMSPQSAQSLVPPPPNSPPASDTAQSTPQTGSLKYAPQQAQPKVVGPPMQPGRTATGKHGRGQRIRNLVATTGIFSWRAPTTCRSTISGGLPSW